MILRLLLALLACASVASADYVTVVNADSPKNFWKLNETGGQGTANDSGSDSPAKNLTFNGSPTQGVAGKVPGYTGISFNGSTQYATVTTTGGLSPSATDISLECWAYPTALGAWQEVLSYAVAGGSSCGGDAFYLWSLRVPQGASNHAQIVIYDGACGGYINALGSITLTTNTWYHVLGTYKHTATITAKIYVNGTLDATSTSTTGSAGSSGANLQMTLAAIQNTPPNSYGQKFTGTLQMCATYASELTSTQVTTHYNAGAFAWTSGWTFARRFFQNDLRKLDPQTFRVEMPSATIDVPGFLVDRLNRLAVHE